MTEIAVDSRRWWSPSGVRVRRGEVYAIEVPPGQTWRDASNVCGPEGYEIEKLERWIRWRRRRDLPWFALVGATGKDESQTFPVLKGIAEWTAAAGGELYFYANDVKVMYWNNHGSMKVVVRRLR